MAHFFSFFMLSFELNLFFDRSFPLSITALYKYVAFMQ